MVLSLRNQIEWLIGAAAAAGAAALVLQGRTLTPIDRSLPLIAVLAMLAAWLARETRLVAFVASAPVLLIAASIAIPSDQLRLVCYGLVLAGSLFAAGAAISRSGRMPRGRSVILIWVALAALRLPGGELPPLLPLVAIFAGVWLLSLVLSEEGEVTVLGVLLIAGAAIATPMFPTRASLFLLLAAAVTSTLRQKGGVRAFFAAALALAAGKWALPVAFVPIAAIFLFGRSREGLEARPFPPFVTASAAALGRVISFDPSLLLRLITSDGARIVSAVLLAAASLVVRPGIALLYLLAVAVFLLPGRGVADRHAALAAAPAVMVFSILLFFGWSGVSNALFPLPAPPLALLAVALVASVSALLPRRVAWAAGVVTVLLFALMVTLVRPVHPASVPREQIPIPPGGSGTIDLPPNAGGISLIASGANISPLKADTVVGTVEMLDAEGGGYRRVLRTGDIADWGAFRASQWFFTSNSLPRDPSGRLDGYGWKASILGSGRVPLEVRGPLTAIRVTAAQDLPPDARIHIDGVEVASR